MMLYGEIWNWYKISQPWTLFAVLPWDVFWSPGFWIFSVRMNQIMEEITILLGKKFWRCSGCRSWRRSTWSRHKVVRLSKYKGLYFNNNIIFWHVLDPIPPVISMTQLPQQIPTLTQLLHLTFILNFICKIKNCILLSLQMAWRWNRTFLSTEAATIFMQESLIYAIFAVCG